MVVLHDFVLHHLVVGLTFARGDAAGYLAAMEREGGLVGRLLAYAVLDNKLPPALGDAARGLPARRRGPPTTRPA